MRDRDRERYKVGLFLRSSSLCSGLGAGLAGKAILDLALVDSAWSALKWTRHLLGGWLDAPDLASVLRDCAVRAELARGGDVEQALFGPLHRVVEKMIDLLLGSNVHFVVGQQHVAVSESEREIRCVICCFFM